SETDSAGGRHLFRLPIGFKRTVDSFSLRVEVVKPGQAPTVASGAPANFSFRRWNNSYTAESTLRNYPLNSDPVIHLPGKVKQSVQVERGSDGNHYFSVTLPESATGLQSNRTKRGKHTGLPRRIAIYWDASGSMGRLGSDRQRELSLLRSYFARFKGQTVTVRLVLFRFRREAPKTFTIGDGKTGLEDLLEELGSVNYDGGTSMAALAAGKRSKRTDLYFIFTDGNSNFGKDQPGMFNAPVFVFSQAADANHPFLRQLARRSGGVCYNLNRTGVNDVLKTIGQSPYSFISATYDSRTVTGIYPETSRPLRGRFILCGRLMADNAKITLNWGIGGKILKRTPIVLSARDAEPGRLIKTLWAQKKVEALMTSPRRNRKALIETGKQYGLVTPGTSLLVLDNLNQYLEHEIEPPEMLVQMRNEYWQRMKRKRALDRSKKTDKLAAVVGMWQKRLQWWERDFPGHRKEIKKKRAVPAGVEGGAEWGAEGGVDSGVVGGVAGDSGVDAPNGIAGGVRPIMSNALMSSNTNHPQPVPVHRLPPAPAISITGWNPDTPYLDSLKIAGAKNAFSRYMLEKKRYGNSPAFYLDCADYFFKQKNNAIGLQVLSNIAELQLEHVPMLRSLGHRLRQLGYMELSAGIFERVLELRPEEPQSFRDLALTAAALKQYKRAVRLLYHVILNRWDRFRGIELIALMEMNRIIRSAKDHGVTGFPVDPRLVRMTDVDVRVVLTWDADSTDMDLWVTDPTGETSYYKNKLSTIGGLMSNDFTRGYGPEEYVLKKAVNGVYKINVNYYGSRAVKLMGPVTLQVDIFTHWGRENQGKKSITLRLKQRKDKVFVGEIEF
ncbi:MAG: DUF2135 domain-containing protein, partial [bacterium]|nr:DUF2135 domain-containing protein [bacterium]